MVVKQFALSGYWRGNDGLQMEARGCSFVNDTVLLQSFIQLRRNESIFV